METSEVNYRLEVVELRGQLGVVTERVEAVSTKVDRHTQKIDTLEAIQSELKGALKTIKWLAWAGPVVYGLINFLIKVNGS